MQAVSTLLPQLTTPQTELVEKFNAAFYDAQMRGRTPLEDDLLETFDESYFTNIDAYEDPDTDSNYFSDCFVSAKCDETETTTSGIASTFDYTDLSESLELGLNAFSSDVVQSKREHSQVYQDSCAQDCSAQASDYAEYGISFSNFFVPPPFVTTSKHRTCSDVEEMFHFECFKSEAPNETHQETHHNLINDPPFSQDVGKLPPITTITRTNMDFTNFLRNMPPDSLDIFAEVKLNCC